MARRYTSSSRRFRSRKRRRRTNPVRTYVVVVLVLAAGAFGISRIKKGGTLPGAQNEQTITPTHLPSANEPETDTQTQQPPRDTQAQSAEIGDAREDPRESIAPPRQIPDNPKVHEAVSAAVLKSQQSAGGVVELRDNYNDILTNMTMSLDQRAGIQHELEKLSDKWLFGRQIYPGDALCETYVVQPGDTLERIGKRYKVPYELLMDINGIKRASSLQAGWKIKVVNGPFHAVVYRSSFTMDLYQQDTYVKSYQVGLGKPGHETPTGTWLVEEGGKLIRPEWTDPNGRTFYPDDPDYPLGSRWIGLEGIEGDAVGRTGFAIHGTEKPLEIGKNTSQGCIRLHNGNAVEVYNLMMPGLSRVQVFD